MQKAIVIIIGGVALLLFSIGLYKACQLALENKPDKVEYFNTHYWTYIITSINGILIVNLSSLLGLRLFAKENINIRQWVAFAYLIALLVIFLFWARRNFDEGDVMPVVIPQLSKSFFALLLAALGMMLKESLERGSDKKT